MTALNQVFKSYLLLQASYKGNLEEVTKLLNEGVTPNVFSPRLFNYSPLMLAASLQDKSQALAIARLLIEKGALVNHANDKGLTALHLAAIKNNSDLAQLLVAKDANVNLKDKINNETAADIAREKGFLNVLYVVKEQKIPTEVKVAAQKST